MGLLPQEEGASCPLIQPQEKAQTGQGPRLLPHLAGTPRPRATLRPLLGSSFPLDQRPLGMLCAPLTEEGRRDQPCCATVGLRFSWPFLSSTGRRSEDPVLGLCSDPDVVLWGRWRPLAPVPMSQGWAGGLSCRGGVYPCSAAAGGGGGVVRHGGPTAGNPSCSCVLIFCSRPGVWGLGEMRETRAPDQAWSLAGGEHPHPVKRKQAAAEPGLGAHRRGNGARGPGRRGPSAPGVTQDAVRMGVPGVERGTEGAQGARRPGCQQVALAPKTEKKCLQQT